MRKPLQLILTATLLCFIHSAPALSQTLVSGALTEIILQPIADWTVTTEQESCRAHREFSGEGVEGASLHIRSFGPAGAYEISAIAPGLLRDDRRATIIRAGFDEHPHELVGIAATSRSVPMMTFQARGPRGGNLFARGRTYQTLPVHVQISGADEYLLLQAAGMQPHRFRFGPAADVFSMLADCDAQLARKWGFADDNMAALSRPPVLQNRSLMADLIKYPPNLILNRISLIMQIRVNVAADGTATDCVIQAPQWDWRHTRRTCRALERGAVFAPALDKNGNPVAAPFRLSYMMLVFG